MDRTWILVAWRKPRVHSHSLASKALTRMDNDIGSPEEVASLSTDVIALIGSGTTVTHELGSLVIRLPESRLLLVADQVRELIARHGYTLFDPQCGRLVVPAPKGAGKWPPSWSGPIEAVREAAVQVADIVDPTERREAMTREVLTRTGGRIVEPPPKISLPFPTPPGFIVPFLLPERMRTTRRLATLEEKLSIDRHQATTRTGAALELGGWQGHPGAMALLRSHLEIESNAFAKAMCVLGLAVSNAADPADVVSLAEALIRHAVSDLDEDAAAYVVLAALILARQAHDPVAEEAIRGILARKTLPSRWVERRMWQALIDLVNPARVETPPELSQSPE